MASLVYFGTKDKQSWIKAPATGMKASKTGWAAESTLLNGRSFVRSSYGSSRRFDASWDGSYNSSTETSLQHIVNYSDGLYGDGPFYFIDPFAANQNVMPPHWAAPMLASTDWPPLDYAITPTFTKATVANNFPMKYATYITTDDFESEEKLTLIIPTGYKLHFGWHGPTAGSDTGIRIMPYKRSDGTANTAINPVKISAGGTTRTNTQVSGTTYSRVEIYIATELASTLNITAMIAQILPDSSLVASGGFIAGKGIAALEFAQKPQIEYYSSVINQGQIGMSTTWVEV